MPNFRIRGTTTQHQEKAKNSLLSLAVDSSGGENGKTFLSILSQTQADKDGQFRLDWGDSFDNSQQWNGRTAVIVADNDVEEKLQCIVNDWQVPEIAAFDTLGLLGETEQPYSHPFQPVGNNSRDAYFIDIAQAESDLQTEFHHLNIDTGKETINALASRPERRSWWKDRSINNPIIEGGPDPIRNYIQPDTRQGIYQAFNTNDDASYIYLLGLDSSGVSFYFDEYPLARKPIYRLNQTLYYGSKADLAAPNLPLKQHVVFDDYFGIKGLFKRANAGFDEFEWTVPQGWQEAIISFTFHGLTGMVQVKNRLYVWHHAGADKFDTADMPVNVEEFLGENIPLYDVFMRKTSVYKLDPETGAPEFIEETDGALLRADRLNADNTLAVEMRGSQLHVKNADTWETLNQFFIGEYPLDIACDWKNETIYVATYVTSEGRKPGDDPSEDRIHITQYDKDGNVLARYDQFTGNIMQIGNAAMNKILFVSRNAVILSYRGRYSTRFLNKELTEASLAQNVGFAEMNRVYWARPDTDVIYTAERNFNPAVYRLGG